MMPEHAWTRAKRRWLGRVPDRTIALRVGYALKIHSEWTAKNAPDLHRDWGGYGIIAPDLTDAD